MITRAQVLALMPAADGKTTLNSKDVINSDIIKQLHINSARAREITAKAAPLFKGASIEQTCKNIWDFLKREIKYSKDGINQNIKLPNRFILDGSGDCKSYSLFTQSILSNLGIKNAYRYTSYSSVDPTPQHVYNIALNNPISGNTKTDKVIVIDGVWNKFNYQKKFTFKKDFMPINTLSGTGDEIGKISLKGAVKQVKKAASKVQDAVKDTKVVKKAAELQDKAKDTKVVKAAAEVQSAAKEQVQSAGKKVLQVVDAAGELAKKLPNAAKMVVGAPARTAFRGLVALNFHNYANKLNSNKTAAFETWKKLGGNTGDLQASINAGIQRKAILGIGCLECKMQIQRPGINGPGIGDPATIAAALAAATPIIIAMAAILKEGLDVIKKARESLGKRKESAAPQEAPQADSSNSDNEVMQNKGVPEYTPPQDSPGGGNYGGGYVDPGNYYFPNSGGASPNAGESARPEQQPKAEEQTSAAPLILAAVAAKLLFF